MATDNLLDFQIEGVDETLKGIEQLTSFPKSYEQYVKTDILDALAVRNKETFMNQQNPYGEAWSPLSPYTLRIKKTNRIMYETGQLLRSFNIDRQNVSLSFNIAYALKHQLGEPAKRLPQRLLLPIESQGLPSAWETIIETMTNNFLSGYL